VASAVKFSSVPTVAVLFPIGAKTGARFSSFTVTEIAAVPLPAVGVALSVARIVIGYTPGPCASVGVQLNAPDVALIVAPAGAPASKENAIV